MNKLTLALVIISFHVSAQGLLVRSTIVCDSSNVPAVRSAVQTFKPIWTQLADENMITNWEYTDAAKGNRLTLTYTFAVESEAKLKSAFAEYIKRAEKKFPVQYGMYKEHCRAPKDSVRRRGVSFPVIHDNGAFVFQVKDIDESPDPKLNYNVDFDFTSFAELKKDEVDSSKINWGLQQVGRVFNLHAASGIPLEKIHFVVAIHGRAVKTFLNDASYQDTYHIDNPNTPLIRELQKAGVKFVMCGQITTFMKVDKTMLLPGVKMSLTAQTVLTNYQAQGYSLMTVDNQ